MVSLKSPLHFLTLSFGFPIWRNMQPLLLPSHQNQITNSIWSIHLCNHLVSISTFPSVLLATSWRRRWIHCDKKQGLTHWCESLKLWKVSYNRWWPRWKMKSKQLATRQIWCMIMLQIFTTPLLRMEISWGMALDSHTNSGSILQRWKGQTW